MTHLTKSPPRVFLDFYQAGRGCQVLPKRRRTPCCRTLKTGGELNPKYPDGTARQARPLRAEGHRVIKLGKKHLVADYQSRLARP
ncbi:MAG: hypothetical protein ABIK43_05080 [candidate division WOR-3 bacterium]